MWLWIWMISSFQIIPTKPDRFLVLPEKKNQPGPSLSGFGLPFSLISSIWFPFWFIRESSMGVRHGSTPIARWMVYMEHPRIFHGWLNLPPWSFTDTSIVSIVSKISGKKVPNKGPWWPLILQQATNFTSALRFRLRTSGFGDLVLAAVEALLSSSEVHVLPHWTPVVKTGELDSTGHFLTNKSEVPPTRNLVARENAWSLEMILSLDRHLNIISTSPAALKLILDQ